MPKSNAIIAFKSGIREDYASMRSAVEAVMPKAAKFESERNKIYAALKLQKLLYERIWLKNPGSVGDVVWCDVPRKLYPSSTHIFDGWQVSDTGHVKSPSGDIMLGTIMHDGYRATTLRTAHETISVHIHQLVAHAFVPVADYASPIVHIDNDKTNNHISNLKFVTADQTRVKNSAKVLQYDRNGGHLLKIHDSVADANVAMAESPKSAGLITHLSMGTNQYKGYVFKLAEHSM